MGLLSDADRARVGDRLGALPTPVHLLLFTQTFGCETCPDAKRILDEVASLGPVTVEEVNLVLDRERAAQYSVDRAPTIVFLRRLETGDVDPGLRFVGLPAGYEFMSMLDAIELVSTGDSGLAAETRSLLAGLTEPLSIQVFSTPT